MVKNSTNKSIADVRRYWDARPCNVRHSPKPVGSREYFDEVEARKYLVEPHIPAFAEFERWQGKRVLEVGCGIGTDTDQFRSFRRRCHGRRAVERIAPHRGAAGGGDGGGRPDPLRPGECRGADYGPRRASRTTSRTRSASSTTRRTLIERSPRSGRSSAPGGTLKLMVYHRHSWKVFAIVAARGRGRFWKTDELVTEHSEAQTGCPVTFTYTRRTGRELVEKAGFRVRELQVDHVFPYRISDYVRYRYVKEPYFRCAAEAAFPGIRASVWLAPARDGGSGRKLMRVAVVGLGKLGAPLAAVLASKGNQVLGVDINPSAVELLNGGHAPVEEPGLQKLISASRDRLTATTSVGEAAKRRTSRSS